MLERSHVPWRLCYKYLLVIFDSAAYVTITTTTTTITTITTIITTIMTIITVFLV